MISKAGASTESASPSNGMAVVVGANRGIGLALASQLLETAWVEGLIATHRPGRLSPELEALSTRGGEQVELVALDVTDPESLERFQSRVERIPGGFDLAIHTVGILQRGDIRPERSLEQCNPDHLLRLFEINSIAPLMTARALLSAVPRDRAFTFAALSAMVGSIGDNRLGGWYGYRSSKAALNQLIRTLAVECRRRLPKGIVVAVHPGTTDTELSRPFQRNIDPEKLYSPELSASRILETLSHADVAQSGSFLNWDGSEIPW